MFVQLLTLTIASASQFCHVACDVACLTVPILLSFLHWVVSACILLVHSCPSGNSSSLLVAVV